MIEAGTFQLEETPISDQKALAKSKLINFEYCMRILEQQQAMTPASFEEMAGRLFQRYNVKKQLIDVARQVFVTRSLEYEFKILNKDLSVAQAEDEQRIGIGHVLRGGYSQTLGRGFGFGQLIQPSPSLIPFSIFERLRQEMNHKQQMFILFRNPESFVYQVAELRQ